MEGVVIALNRTDYPDETEEVTEICERASSLEELLLWVRAGRSIVISRDTESRRIENIRLDLLIGSKTVLVVTMPVAEIRAQILGYEPLNETAIEFSDMHGYRPDDEWFDRRNLRLGLYDNTGIGINFGPPSALMELILSYSFSTNGFAELAVHGPEADHPQVDALVLSLYFLGQATNRGWSERTGFYRADLVKYLGGRFWL